VVGSGAVTQVAISDKRQKFIAAVAIIGDNTIRKNGYRTPAAIVTPAVL
jgi:hypothetical protein